jgi:Domain of unknown function (DUF5122) beta-propeller
MKNKFVKITSTLLILWFIFIPGCKKKTTENLWTKAYGGTGPEASYSVQPTSDGGYIIAGWTGSFGNGNHDAYLIKIDIYGDTFWTKTFGGTDLDWGRSATQTSDGGYIVAGWTASYGAGGTDVYLIKTDANGNLTWTKTFGGQDDERGFMVQLTSDGGYIIVGTTWSFGAGNGDVYLVKSDTNGDTSWTRTYGGTGYDFCRSVKPTSDGGYILAGQTGSFGSGNWDVYLIKTNSNGDIQWTKTYGGPDDDLGCSVEPTSDDGYIVTGGTMSFGAGDWDVYIIKTNSTGDALWTKVYGGPLEERCHEIKETPDGGYSLIGFTASFGAGEYDFYFLRTDANGDTLWTKTYGGTDSDIGEAFHETSDGGYIMVGETNSFGVGGGDVYLIKTDANGNTK